MSSLPWHEKALCLEGCALHFNNLAPLEGLSFTTSPVEAAIPLPGTGCSVPGRSGEVERQDLVRNGVSDAATRSWEGQNLFPELPFLVTRHTPDGKFA